MKYEYNHGNRSITRDGQPWAHIDRHADRTTGVIHLPDENQVLDYRVYGPFGQGHNIGIFKDSTEIETLSYHWREGGLIHPSQPKVGLRFSGSRLYRDEKLLGKASRAGYIIRIDIQREVAPLNECMVVLILILDIQWANKIMLFERR